MHDNLYPNNECKPSSTDSSGMAGLVRHITPDMRGTLCEGVFLGLFESMNTYHHHFGINCKISGSVFSVSEIRGAVPLIHGPAGCAFHQRLTPWRMYASVYNVESTNLGENDVIYGGEKKLREGIQEAYRKYRPSLIVVLPTCVSGLIGDDISGICQDIRSEVSCDIVHVNSVGFAHRGRELEDGLEHTMVSSWTSYQSSVSEEYELKGCGQEEVAKALVDQVMEEQDVLDNLVNVESIGRCRVSFRSRLTEMRRLFASIGIGINTTLLGCTVEDIRRAPAAFLNIVTHNRIGARQMQERFGTGVFKKSPAHCGIEGTERFYVEVASLMGLGGEAESALKNEKKSALEALQKQKKLFSNYKFALTSQNYLFNPYMIKALADDLGISVRYYCVNAHQPRDLFLPPEKTLKLLQANLEMLFASWGLDTQIIVNPSLNEVQDIAKDISYMISNGPVGVFCEDDVKVRVIDISAMNYLLLQNSFKGIVEFSSLLARKIQTKALLQGSRPILSNFCFDQIHYPLMDDDSCTSSRKMWDLWKSGVQPKEML